MISVIVPIYNAEEYLKRCLDSLAKQSFRDFEVILINDGSTDSSQDIIDSFLNDNSSWRFKNKLNSGPSDTRNAGIELAKGDYLAFVDADDYLETDYLQALHQNLTENNSDLACCGYFDHSELGILALTNYAKILEFSSKKVFADYVLDRVGGVLWDKLFIKAIIIENDIKLNSEVRLSEDLLFVLEYLFHIRKISIVDKSLYNYNRLYENRLSKIISITQLESVLRVNDLLVEKLKNLDFSEDKIKEIQNKRLGKYIFSFMRSISEINLKYSKKIKFLNHLRSLTFYKMDWKTYDVDLVNMPFKLFFINKLNRSILVYGRALNMSKKLNK